MKSILKKIKRTLERHKHLIAILIGIKCCLRHGFKAGWKKYLRFKPLTKRDLRKLYTITVEQKKIETKYNFSKKIKFSVLVPLYNTPEKYLIDMIESVQDQTYANWELCLADGSDDDHSYVMKACLNLAKKDKRIKYKRLEENKGISENTNECIKMASGDYIALFDHDDILHPSALFECMKAICEKNADFVYTDEITFLEDDMSNMIVFNYKPDFSIDTLRSYNYICHLSVFDSKLLETTGYFNHEYDGSQDYDMILRLTEAAKNIVHIKKALYFWRAHKNSVASDISAKPYTIDAAVRAINAHLKRVGIKGTAVASTPPSTYKINYEIEGAPLISIIIPNKDNIDVLDVCIKSILSKSTYSNYEIIIIENNSTEESTFAYYKSLENNSKIKIVTWKGEFNYSAINNFGAKHASGEYYLLLNNDIEVITENWLEEMLMYAQRSDVGAVGSILYYPDDTIQHAGVILGIGGVAGHSHKGYNRGDYGYMSRASITQNLSAVTFACVMMKASVFNQVEGLDEGFKVAFNDVDMCMRIRKAGYSIVFTPHAELYHHESKSRGQEDTPEKVKRFQSEIERFYSKWDDELKAGDPYYNPNLTLTSEDFKLDIKFE